MKEKKLLTGKRKKLARGIAVGAAAAAAVMGITFWKDVYPGRLLNRWLRPAAQEMDMGPTTATVERLDVEQLFNTTGSIISSDTASVNARAVEGGAATGYIVDEVYVKIGDMVNEGDLLYTVDMSVTKAELDIQKKKLALSERSNAIDAGAESRKLAEAQASSVQQNAADTRKLQQTADDLNWALVDDTEASAAVKLYIEREEEAKHKYQSAKAEFDSLNSEYEAKQAAEDNAKYRLAIASAGDVGAGPFSHPAEQEALNKASAELAKITASYTQAKAAADEAKSVYDTAVSDRKTAESTLSSGDKALVSQYRALLDQGDAVIISSRTQYETEQSQRDAVAKQEIARQASSLDTEAAIQKAEEKLVLGEVTAPISGTVTAVNVSAGLAYSGSNAVEIQNTASMKATADIDEAQIADIREGMTVRVTTDATGTEPLIGVVCFVSPIPTTDATNSATATTTTSSAASAKKKRATYRVDVDLGDSSDRLRIGMTTKMDFVLKEDRDTLAVPKTCLNDNGMGGKYVMRVLGDGTDLTQTEDVPVEVGAENDFYAAVSGEELNEGDILVDSGSAMGMDGGGEAGGMLNGMYN
ncbi:HlyD family efflux transporter periplasmic adaptor subunit [Lachnoclostridium sp. Marseille-P6806]|uniref:HlyD family efflux transporter periplasmic adaptor subunit n=1 Tax=Lachnoclostridium sp. Marseille-P6806 TaxID=2364793 RepID=UPI00102F7359|nr:HlyD family efflux transporter periplasmic adaptor subunit [Lachnoclostridium sp. Marseille-P6806]